MKEIYSKPMLEVVSFELNEAIASCEEKVHNNWGHGSCEDTDLGKMLEGMGVTFTQDKDSCADGAEYEGYCYFTSQQNGGFLLFNS